MKRLIWRLRIWLSGIISPNHSLGLIKHDALGWFVANIKFDGVTVTNLEHGIVIFAIDKECSPYESIMLVSNELIKSVHSIDASE